MKIAFFDCFSGASGDMILGALVSAGWPAAQLEAILSLLGIRDYRIAVTPVVKQGIAATSVRFEFPDEPHTRRLGDLCQILVQSPLPQSVRDPALRVLRRLGTVEAKVHGLDVPADDVELHELGSLDTLFDVVGAVAGLADLGVAATYVSPLQLGGGMVRTAHGRLPVPVPAVAELVKGLPVIGGEAGDGELVTPTGAALLTTLATGYGSLPAMSVERVGYGAGQRERATPNVLRLWLGEAPARDGTADEVVRIEANVDDLSPELCGPLIDRLLDRGALDAYWLPVTMKKGRPALLLNVLGYAEQLPALEEAIFRETTTLGIRYHVLQRHKLEREIVAVDTPYGPVRVKLGRRSGKVITVAPEFEDCRRAAEDQRVPVRVVYDAAKSAFEAGQPR